MVANEIRGERDIMIGGKAFALALRLETLAKLEAAFAVESFEEVFAQLSKKCEIETGATLFQPIAGALAKFWRVVAEVEGSRLPGLVEAVETRPYALLAAAFALRGSLFDDWFSGDRPAEGAAPLEGAGAGANGFAAPARPE